MAADRSEDADDDALRWEGDEELGRMTSLDSPRIGGRADSVERDALPAPGEPTSSAVLRDELLFVLTIVAGALFLAETVGWVLVLQGVQASGQFATGSGVLDFLGGILRFLALVAAPLWFVATVQLTRELRAQRRRIRLGWLGLGLGLLAPWPLLLAFLR